MVRERSMRNHACYVRHPGQGVAKNRVHADRFDDSGIPDRGSHPLGIRRTGPVAAIRRRLQPKEGPRHYHAALRLGSGDPPCRRIHLARSSAADAESVLLYLCTCSLASRMDANLLH